ncbi:LysR substrate-binding domain-containing protein [Caballeronia sp. ATUFL_M2_KS44]|uniref:LysR substrate-binding domain-containing protein n=1 Tax=Caballeronia sp. ATUFL_M2_KS44 TaxID=2921767 RepID=UPI0020289A45|nr:LysR substrate-binding domain-containing protein [Caballeronia sp. ATUFL_M2_KS44]
MPALNALRAFEVAGHTGSFTRAAAVLHVTQSAVSRQVRQLETQLGETLLLRRHHHLELTPTGRLLLQALKMSFDGIELTARSIQEKSHLRRLRINAPPTFTSRWLMPRLQSLRETAPELQITLTTSLKDNLVESGALDCAIRFGNGEWDGLDNQLLMNERHIAVCAPALLGEHAASQGGVDLTAFTLLHVLASSDQRYLTWQHWLKAAQIDDVDLGGGYEFDLLDHAIRAAVDGLGVTIADRHMIAPELQSRALVPLLDVEVDGHQSYWFVTRTGQQDAPQVALFREWLQGQVEAKARKRSRR